MSHQGASEKAPEAPQDPFRLLQTAMAALMARQEKTEDTFERAINNIQAHIDRLTAAQNASSAPATASTSHTVSSDPHTPTLRSSTSKIKPATPSDFSGDRTRGRAFLNSCQTYIRLCPDHFPSDQHKILWALSFMKDGRAAKWADQIFRWEEAHDGSERFLDWEDFSDEFRQNFFPLDVETAAVNRLEGTGYYQRARSVEDYLDEFLELISDSGYTDGRTIVVKFRRGLRSEIQDAVATMSTGRPSNTNPEAWYQAARTVDQNRIANEAFHATGRSSHAPKPLTTIPRVPPTSTTSSNSLPRPSAPFGRTNAHTTPTPSKPVPMDIDATRKPSALPPVCFRCKEPGHIKSECPKRFDVRLMDQDEKEEWIQRLLAEKDAAEAQRASEESQEASGEDFATDSW